MNCLNRAISSITNYYDLVGEDHMLEEIRCRNLPLEIQQAFEVLRAHMKEEQSQSSNDAPFLSVVFRINS